MLNNDNFKTLPNFFCNLKNIMRIEVTITENGCDIDETCSTVIQWLKDAGIDQWTEMLETNNKLSKEIDEMKEQLTKCTCKKTKIKIKQPLSDNEIYSSSDTEIRLDNVGNCKKNTKKSFKSKNRKMTGYNVFVSEKVKNGELLFKECGYNWKQLSIDEKNEYINKAKQINENQI